MKPDSVNNPTDPHFVNDLPYWCPPDFPAERRCRFVFQGSDYYRDRRIQDCHCGYPAVEGDDRCFAHRQCINGQSGLRDALEVAVTSQACLAEATLHGANLEGAQIAGALLWSADLSDANLGWADLSGADLDSADLSGANLQRAKLSNANMQSAKLLRRTNLRWANLMGAELFDADIGPDVDLDGVHWWPEDRRPAWQRCLQLDTPTLRAETDIETQDRVRIHVCERLYRQIKRAYQTSGHYDEAAGFFVREMECKRKQLFPFDPMRLIYHALHFVCDYFENPWRVAGISLSLILLFALLQGAVGIHLAASSQPPTEGPLVAGPGLAAPTAENIAAFGRALYMSAITFTATGYGDYVPAWGLGQFIAAIEALLGVFLMATFLVCLARRFGRA